MHYGRTDFSDNEQDTITPKESFAVIGQRDGMSNSDKEELNNVYGWACYKVYKLSITFEQLEHLLNISSPSASLTILCQTRDTRKLEHIGQSKDPFLEKSGSVCWSVNKWGIVISSMVDFLLVIRTFWLLYQHSSVSNVIYIFENIQEARQDSWLLF